MYRFKILRKRHVPQAPTLVHKNCLKYLAFGWLFFDNLICVKLSTLWAAVNVLEGLQLILLRLPEILERCRRSNKHIKHL